LSTFYDFLKERKTGKNFTLIQLVEGLKNVNITRDYTKDIMTKDISKIDMAVDAASFLFGLIQTYLRNKKPSKTAEIPGTIIHFTNSSNIHGSNNNMTFLTNVNINHGSNFEY